MDVMDKFLGGNFRVGNATDTKEDKIEFLKLLDERGVKWRSGHKLFEWDFALNKGCYSIGTHDGYLGHGYSEGAISIKEFLRMYKEEQIMFEKSDLKSGMLVELRNGRYYTVVMDYETEHHGTGAMFGKGGGFIHIDIYNNDLTNNLLGEFDIVKVYKPKCDGDVLSDDIHDFNLIWEREQIKEMTVDEISEALGYKVKVVGNN